MAAVSPKGNSRRPTDRVVDRKTVHYWRMRVHSRKSIWNFTCFPIGFCGSRSWKWHKPVLQHESSNTKCLNDSVNVTSCNMNNT
jgi:hypothetical protein